MARLSPAAGLVLVELMRHHWDEAAHASKAAGEREEWAKAVIDLVVDSFWRLRSERARHAKRQGVNPDLFGTPWAKIPRFLNLELAEKSWSAGERLELGGAVLTAVAELLLLLEELPIWQPPDDEERFERESDQIQEFVCERARAVKVSVN